MRLRWALSAAVACALLSPACGDPLAPFQPEVGNVTDNFQFQATGVAGVTDSRAYVWQNTGTRATVNHSTVTENGLAHVRIRDSAGQLVYDADLAASRNEPTAAGAAGAWRIELTLNGFTGTINFRVQKL